LGGIVRRRGPAGRVEEGLEHIRKAFRLNAFPASWYYLTLGQAQYAARDYAAAIATLRKGTRPIGQAHAVSWRQALPSSAGSTRRERRSNRSSSATRVSQPATGRRPSHSTTLEHFIDGYHNADLPERQA